MMLFPNASSNTIYYKFNFCDIITPVLLHVNKGGEPRVWGSAEEDLH